jgi:hypothetical protein
MSVLIEALDKLGSHRQAVLVEPVEILIEADDVLIVFEMFRIVPLPDDPAATLVAAHKAPQCQRLSQRARRD